MLSARARASGRVLSRPLSPYTRVSRVQFVAAGAYAYALYNT